MEKLERLLLLGLIRRVVWTLLMSWPGGDIGHKDLKYSSGSTELYMVYTESGRKHLNRETGSRKKKKVKEMK